MNAKKKIPNPRTPTSVRADIVAAILELGARQRARMSAGQHLYNKVDLRAWLDVAAERYLMAELEAERAAERASNADAQQLPVPTPQQEVPKHPAAPAQQVDQPTQVAPAQPQPVKPAEPAPLAPKSPWADRDHDRSHDQDRDDQDPAPQTSPPQDPADAATYKDFEGVRIRVGWMVPRAGYVHWRPRRHVLGAALEAGVPAEVIHHAELMRQNLNPTALGWKRAEKLIVQVREAVDKGKDPAPLWARWMPAGRKRS